ncbi:MAG TPA: hypothetical protein VIT92_06430, partial [Burkholderiaceae bacterium]
PLAYYLEGYDGSRTRSGPMSTSPETQMATAAAMAEAARQQEAAKDTSWFGKPAINQDVADSYAKAYLPTFLEQSGITSVLGVNPSGVTHGPTLLKMMGFDSAAVALGAFTGMMPQERWMTAPKEPDPLDAAVIEAGSLSDERLAQLQNGTRKLKPPKALALDVPDSNKRDFVAMQQVLHYADPSRPIDSIKFAVSPKLGSYDAMMMARMPGRGFVETASNAWMQFSVENTVKPVLSGLHLLAPGATNADSALRAIREDFGESGQFGYRAGKDNALAYWGVNAVGNALMGVAGARFGAVEAFGKWGGMASAAADARLDGQSLTEVLVRGAIGYGVGELGDRAGAAAKPFLQGANPALKFGAKQAMSFASATVEYEFNDAVDAYLGNASKERPSLLKQLAGAPMKMLTSEFGDMIVGSGKFEVFTRAGAIKYNLEQNRRAFATAGSHPLAYQAAVEHSLAANAPVHTAPDKLLAATHGGGAGSIVGGAGGSGGGGFGGGGSIGGGGGGGSGGSGGSSGGGSGGGSDGGNGGSGKLAALFDSTVGGSAAPGDGGAAERRAAALRDKLVMRLNASNNSGPSALGMLSKVERQLSGKEAMIDRVLENLGKNREAINHGDASPLYKVEQDMIKARQPIASSSPEAQAVRERLGLVTLDPNKIRFTQTTVKQQGATIPKLVASMEKHGFLIEPEQLIDVVRMPDGKLTSLDNTRILAASRAGIQIEARVFNHDDPLPNDPQYRARFPNKKDELPNTYGEAVSNRINNQAGAFRKAYPMGATITGSSY